MPKKAISGWSKIFTYFFTRNVPQMKEFGGCGGNGTSPVSPSPSVHGALGKLKIRCIGKGNYEGALGGKRKKHVASPLLGLG